MAKLKLDLHDIYNRGGKIDAELNRIVQEALAKKIALVEIIPGKGSGQLKKTVLRFLNQGHSRAIPPRGKRRQKLRAHFYSLQVQVTCGGFPA